MPAAGVKPLFVVGPLPPPVHGASMITRSMVDLLRTSCIAVVECNISPSAKVRGWRWHISRARAYIRTLRRIIAVPSGSMVYIALSGGNGLIYDLLVVLSARLKAHRLTLHHHSFDYVDRDRLVFSLLLMVAPRRHLHLVLCQDMARKLMARYRRKLDYCHISNLCFFPPRPIAARERSELQSIGFLSNISLDKGIDRFLDLAGRLAARDDIRFHIAGPFANEDARLYVERRLADLPNVIYRGPLYGEQKQEFYDTIDLFVFLSRYSNEAEPLVIYEAMSAGLPVVVTARGCLCEMADPEAAVIIDRNGDDIDSVVRRITEWKDVPESYARACVASTRHLEQLEKTRGEHLETLLAAFRQGFSTSSDEARLPQPAT